MKKLKGGKSMKKMGSVLVMLVLFSFLLSGCYYFAANKEIKNAEKAITQLKAAGGEKTAPYEYCSAEAFLAGAKKEFSENDFKPAKELASRSRSAAEAGLAKK
jgi:hypothetical protein